MDKKQTEKIESSSRKRTADSITPNGIAERATEQASPVNTGNEGDAAMRANAIGLNATQQAGPVNTGNDGNQGDDSDDGDDSDTECTNPYCPAHGNHPDMLFARMLARAIVSSVSPPSDDEESDDGNANQEEGTRNEAGVSSSQRLPVGSSSANQQSAASDAEGGMSRDETLRQIEAISNVFRDITAMASAASATSEISEARERTETRSGPPLSVPSRGPETQQQTGTIPPSSGSESQPEANGTENRRRFTLYDFIELLGGNRQGSQAEQAGQEQTGTVPPSSGSGSQPAANGTEGRRRFTISGLFNSVINDQANRENQPEQAAGTAPSTDRPSGGPDFTLVGGVTDPMRLTYEQLRERAFREAVPPMQFMGVHVVGVNRSMPRPGTGKDNPKPAEQWEKWHFEEPDVPFPDTEDEELIKERCILCNENYRKVIAVSCGHFHFCYSCANKLRPNLKCPCCNSAIYTMIKPFM